MTAARQQRARRAEALVAAHLRGQGFKILGMNVRVGRLELDIVAMRGRLLVVCEVRSRSSSRYGSAVDTLAQAKVRRVRQATSAFVREKRIPTREIRLDAAAVLFGPAGAIRMDYFENAL